MTRRRSASLIDRWAMRINACERKIIFMVQHILAYQGFCWETHSDSRPKCQFLLKCNTSVTLKTDVEFPALSSYRISSGSKSAEGGVYLRAWWQQRPLMDSRFEEGDMFNGRSATELKGNRMSPEEKAEIDALFARHINSGQLKYLRSAHLDVLETERLGVRFTDSVSGKRMYDCFTCAGAFNVSRHNPLIMKALEEALDDLDLGSYNLLSVPKLALARKLSSLAPGDLKGVLFAAGGGDAIDCAIKLARGATGRQEIIATVKAYHGHTGFSLSANGKDHYRHYFEPLMPGFTFAPFNDLEAARKLASDKTAAIILEPVQGEAGIFPATNEYLRGLRKICDDKGIILIFDEIQTGLGRTGKLFACEHSGVVPDIMALSKSLSGALFPSAAVLYRKTPIITDFLNRRPNFHVSCGGGSDIACRVSLKVLEFIEEHRLWENAARMGARLKGALEDLMRENPKIVKEVRGLGLMVGIEYCHEFMGPMMSEALGRHNIWAAYSGNAPQVMRFMVPITVNDQEMDEIIAAIRAAVKDMKSLLPVALLAAKIPGVLKLLNSEKVQVATFGFLRRIEELTGKKR